MGVSIRQLIITSCAIGYTGAFKCGGVAMIDVICKEEDRYIVIDKGTGEVLDDAQGYGYKSKKNAYSAYAYKNRDRSKDKEKEQKKMVVKKFCRNNKSFVRGLEEDAFCIAKGSYGSDDKFDAKWVKQAFKEKGFKDLPFTPVEFLKYWE